MIKLYTLAWLPWLPLLLDVLRDVQPSERVVLRLSREVRPQARRSTGCPTATRSGGAPPEPGQFRENDLVFAADVVHGQKTGFFLDQRDNRARVAGWRRAGGP